ncbi:MAG: zinc-ribbon domain-containing protein, partial [Firmicutes bacterium]|nr:zinc-ribbon domain-containing protein [Bacillota bacterium]
MLREGLLGQWAEELNLPLRPEMVTPGSHRMVWWRCEHGHVWRAAVYSRSVCGT